LNPEHLFLGTQQDNIADMRAKGRGYDFPLMCGERNPTAKMTADDVRVIRFAFAGGGATQPSLGEVFKVTQANISEIIRRRTWKSIGAMNSAVSSRN
jgi:hypothetical protein